MATQTVDRNNQNETEDHRNQQNAVVRESTGEDFYDLVSEVSDSCQRYCLHRPKVVAGLIFSIGFVLGWKLRPW